MADLSLRFRVFLFFALIGGGGLVVIAAALWLGFRQLGDPDAVSAFISAGLVAGFGLLALATFVWRLFDEHVCKPIEALAAQFRVRADADIEASFDC